MKFKNISASAKSYYRLMSTVNTMYRESKWTRRFAWTRKTLSTVDDRGNIKPIENSSKILQPVTNCVWLEHYYSKPVFKLSDSDGFKSTKIIANVSSEDLIHASLGGNFAPDIITIIQPDGAMVNSIFRLIRALIVELAITKGTPTTLPTPSEVSERYSDVNSPVPEFYQFLYPVIENTAKDGWNPDKTLDLLSQKIQRVKNDHFE